MTAKEYLLQYKWLTARLEAVEKDLDSLRVARESMSVNYDGMPHGTGISDKTAKLAAEIVDMESKLLDLRSELWRKRIEISDTIGKTKNADYNSLLYMRYIEGCTWEEIAVEMHYTFRWVLVLHGRALDEIQKILENS